MGNEHLWNRRQFLIAAGLASAGASAPALKAEKMRGLMVDAARLPESMAYYRRVIEFCSDWEFNTLHFRLTDDQGSVLRFTSVPNLITHPSAFTPEQLAGLVEYGRSHGVSLLPEVESFGHTGFITRSPTYAHLADTDPKGDAEFTGIVPVHPETLALFAKLYREVAGIFPSVYFHGGCDEVNWGGSDLSRKALASRGRAQIWTEYLNALNAISVGLGKRFVVWGDFVLHKEPQILDHLDKNIVIMDWSYTDNDSAGFREALQRVSSRGSSAIGAPALVCYRWGPRVGTEQLRNIDACADAYNTADEHALGVVVTNWAPSRYVQNSIWDGFAYAAIACKQGTATAQTSGFRRFVEKHYHAPWNETWDEIFSAMYHQAPYRNEPDTSSWMGRLLPVPWASDAELRAVLKQPPMQNPFPHLRSLLAEVEPLVMRNLDDFQAFALSVQYLEALLWRHDVVAAEVRKGPIHADAATLLIAAIAGRDHYLAILLNDDWDKGRAADSIAKRESIVFLEPGDQMLYQWTLAAAYSATLAAQPDRFHRLLQEAG